MIIPFVIIPVFWPILIFQYFVLKKANQSIETQIETALAYWNLQKDEVIGD